MVITIPHTQSNDEQDHRPLLRALIITSQVNSSLTSIFNQCGYATTTSTIKEARNQVKPAYYDLFCVEISPHNNNGLDLIPLLQLENQKSDIITMTRDNQRFVERQARALKVNYHLIFPFSTNEIVSILTHLATRNRQQLEA